MDVSLVDACRLLGKTPRQVRYLVKKGELHGRKVSGRWVVDAADLPISEGQRAARASKEQQLRDTVEKALGPARARPYGVADLVAFQAGVRVHAALLAALGAAHPAVDAVSAALVALAQGYHRFHDRDKLDAYRLAREEAARAAALVLLSGHAEAEGLAAAIEREVLPSILGLVRRCERRKP